MTVLSVVPAYQSREERTLLEFTRRWERFDWARFALAEAVALAVLAALVLLLGLAVGWGLSALGSGASAGLLMRWIVVAAQHMLGKR